MLPRCPGIWVLLELLGWSGARAEFINSGRWLSQRNTFYFHTSKCLLRCWSGKVGRRGGCTASCLAGNGAVSYAACDNNLCIDINQSGGSNSVATVLQLTLLDGGPGFSIPISASMSARINVPACLVPPATHHFCYWPRRFLITSLRKKAVGGLNRPYLMWLTRAQPRFRVATGPRSGEGAAKFNGSCAH